jgi:putative acetyltransferase
MATLPEDTRLRPLRDEDSAALITLIGAAYDEYPGCVMDLPGVDADLLGYRTFIEGKGGDAWAVVDGEGRLIACCGWAPSQVHGEPALELKRLYVTAIWRRRGIAAALTGKVEAVAREKGLDLVEVWSDSRFLDAHRLYERLGYRKEPDTRELHDPSNTTELHFLKRVDG